MANFPTDNAELDAYVERFPMGSNWDGLTDVQRLQFNAATLTLWQTLDWHVSPFDNEAVRDQLNGIYAVHLRHIAEKDANPEEMLPKFIRALLLSWARFDGHVRGFPAIFPQAAEAGAAEDETPLTPASDRTAVRLGWEQTRTFTELAFDRPSPPIGGSIAGLDGDEIITPPFPPALSGDDTLFLGVWVSGDPEFSIENVGLTTIDYTSFFPVADKQPLTVDGVAGNYYPITFRLGSDFAGEPFIVTVV